MALTETSLCNQALARLGSERIMSLDDGSKAARFCRLFYAQTRDELLRSHHWNFAIARETLLRLAEEPLFGWAYQYALPRDFIRLVQLNGYGETEAQRSSEIEGGALLTNETEARIRYVRRVEDAGLFDPLFAEALMVKLASKLAQPLTGSRGAPGELLAEYERITAPLARRVDAQEDRRRRKEPWVESSFVRARMGGGFASQENVQRIEVPVEIPGGSGSKTDVGFVANVLDFGAKGNGADDHLAITKALQAVISNGSGTVFFPGGRTYRAKTHGKHGLHIAGKSNIRIEMGEGAALVMDNMAGGVGTSHGIFVEGPCENLTFHNVHVRYAEMAMYRQTWGTFYFLGANVGTGDMHGDGWYRGEPGGERPELIAAGSIRNVRMTGCRAENSPSTFCGVINVDGILIDDFTGHQSWADGIYLRCMRKGRISNVRMDYVGDDGVSIGTEESNLALANIDNDFHSEGTVISNVQIQYNYPVDDGHAGSIVPLGCRDVSVTNVTVIDRYRAVRFEYGTETSGVYHRLNLNFLANKNLTISNLTAHNTYQTLQFAMKEFNRFEETDPKWWHHRNVLLSNIRIFGCFVPLSAYGISGGIPDSSTPPPEGPKMVAGVTFDNIQAQGVTSIFTNLAHLFDCSFFDIKSDNDMTFEGFCPFRGNIDDARYEDNHCVFDNIESKKLTFLGLKRCLIGRATSRNAAETGVSITTCADVHFDLLEGINCKRAMGPFGNNIAIDLYCRRITGTQAFCEQDDIFVADLFSINNNENHWIELVTVKCDLAEFDKRISDSSLNQRRISQIGKINWIQTEYPNAKWRQREYGRFQIEVNGNTDLNYYPNGDTTMQAYGFPLTGDRTVTLRHDSVSIGAQYSFQRRAVATGPYKIAFRGERAPRDVGNLLIKNIEASGQFVSSGPEHLVFGRIAINARIVNNTAAAIEAPYLGIYTDPLNSDAHFAPVTVDSADIGDIEIGEEGHITHLLDVAMLRSTNGSNIHLPNGTFKIELRNEAHTVLATATLVVSALGMLQKVFSGADSIAMEAAPRELSPTYYCDPIAPVIYPIYQTEPGRTGTWDFVFDAASDSWICVRETTDNLQPVSPDRGNASVTIVPRVDAPVQYFGTALTANRTVSLSTVGALNGDAFTVVRKAPGAFTLSVGGLIDLAVNEWCEVAYNGTAWILSKRPGAGGGGGGGDMIASNNLSDLTDPTEALTNLGAGTAGAGILSIEGDGIDEFLRINADKSITLFNATNYRNAIGLGSANTGAIGFTSDGGGSTVTVGTKGYFIAPWAGTITGWSVVAEGASPTATIDVWRAGSGSALPTVADTIMGTKPQLSTGNAQRSTTLTSWSTAFSSGDIFGFNVDAASNATRITFSLEVSK